MIGKEPSEAPKPQTPTPENRGDQKHRVAAETIFFRNTFTLNRVASSQHWVALGQLNRVALSQRKRRISSGMNLTPNPLNFKP